jgi:hypothetical protein
VGGRTRRARNVIWLTPESLRAAEHLSSLTGVSVPDLIELVLIELAEHEDQATPASGPTPCPRRPRGPARVIPIQRARTARARLVAGQRPAAEECEQLRRRCQELRGRSEQARSAAARARERATALLREHDQGW